MSLQLIERGEYDARRFYRHAYAMRDRDITQYQCSEYHFREFDAAAKWCYATKELRCV